jgi:hypothetical protein
MAGYGNRTMSDLDPNDLTHEHTNTRFGREDSHAYTGGHEKFGSGATGGAGFGSAYLALILLDAPCNPIRIQYQ